MAISNPGDLVWAKMKGFPPWPAMVSLILSFLFTKIGIFNSLDIGQRGAHAPVSGRQTSSGIFRNQRERLHETC